MKVEFDTAPDSRQRGTVRLHVATLGSVFLKVGHAASGLAVSILLARLLGADGYGRYSVAYALVVLVALPIQGGLPILLVRDVARYAAERAWDRLAGLLRRGDQLLLLLVVAVLMLGVVGWVLGIFRDWAGPLYFWAFLLLPLTSLVAVRGAALVGLGSVVKGQLPERAVRPGAYLLGLVGVLLFPLQITPSTAMALHAGAAAVAAIVAIYLLAAAMPSDLKEVEPKYDTSFWLRSLAPLSLLAGLEAVNHNMDVVLLGWLTDAHGVGVYRAASQASMLVFFVLAAANAVAAPYMAKAHRAGDWTELQRLAQFTARAGLLGGIPAALLLVWLGSPILAFVFGPASVSGGAALRILAIGQLVGVSIGSVGFLLNMSGHENDTVVVSAVAVLLNLLLNLALIPALQMLGAAVATAGSLIAWNVLLMLRVRSRSRITSLAWGARLSEDLK